MISGLEPFALALQFSVGIVFLFAALPKLRYPMAFARTVAEYKILPPQLAYLFAFALIPLEIFVAVAFLTGWMIGFAAPIAFALLFIFIIAVGINVRRGRQIACGCFGNSSEQISRRTVARLSMLLFAVLLLLVVQNLGDAVSTPLTLLTANGQSLLYLAQISILASSLILFASWILNLPEALQMIRYSYQNP